MRILLIALFIFATAFFAATTHAASAWKAGAAKVVITPQEPLPMAGYASRGGQGAQGKISDLFAKTLALEDGDGHRVLLVTLDLVGIDRGTSQSLCRAIESRHGLKREQIALCCSHTHSGPVVGVNLAPMHYYLLEEAQKRQVDEHTQWMQDRIVAAAGEAIKSLAPCELAWVNGHADFAVNRRSNPEAQVPNLRREGKLKGPVDHDVPVLTVKDASGKVQAVVFGYACHATVLSLNQWCGDYPGFAQAELEKRHEGCVALFWAGCGADQNPLPRRTVELAQEYGRRLADAVDEAIKSSGQTITGPLQASYQEIALPLAELPSREQIVADTQSENRYIAARAKSLLAKLTAGPLEQTYPFPVQLWRLGSQVEWIFLGGEVVVDYALRIKSERRGTATWVAGYANDVMAYIPSRRVLAEGGYEGGGAMIYYGLPTVWAPEVEEQIVSEAARQATVK